MQIRDPSVANRRSKFVAKKRLTKQMKRKNIIIAILTFIVGFGSTFYIIRTYFPKHKVEKTATFKNTFTKTEK